MNSKKATTKIIHINENAKSARKSNSSIISTEIKKSQISIPLPPPPPIALAPPPPPPPIALPKLRKLVIPSKSGKSAAGNSSNNTSTGPITLANVLGVRSQLKKVQFSNKSNDDAKENTNSNNLPKPGFGISLSDISSIQLRKSAGRPVSTGSKLAKTSVSNSIFKLRNTGVQRSPGGTPFKENIAINENTPANIFTNALKKKFEHTRSPDVNRSPNSIPSSPYESPKSNVLSVR